MSVRLSKEESERLLESRKDTVKRVCLKKAETNDLISRVAVVLDISSSMRASFQSGVVQATLERLLPIALTFDDDGEMEFWTFNNDCQRYGAINKDNYYTYLKDNKIEAEGGTCYAPVIQDTARYFSVESPSSKPAYVIFLTDGDNSDRSMCDVIISAASYFPVFYQFIGIGSNNVNEFSYLKQLDTMEGRYVDNANFFAIKSLADIEIISDEDLYTNLLKEYTQWLKNAAVKKMLYTVDDMDRKKARRIKTLNADFRAKIARREKRRERIDKFLDVLGLLLGD